MEMDIDMLQYRHSVYKIDDNNSGTPYKPHQKAIEAIENNKELLCFDKIVELLGSVKTDTDLFLEDNSKVSCIIRDKVIQIGIKLPDGSMFAGVWSKASSKEEFNDMVSS